MKVNFDQIGTNGILSVSGEINAEHSPRLRKAIEAAKAESVKGFVLDLTEVSFVDSTGLGLLISLLRHAQEHGGQLVLCGLQTEVQEIFTMTRLQRVFEICNSVEEAMQKLIVA